MKKKNLEIAIEINKLELAGVDSYIDGAKLLITVLTPVCAALLSAGPKEWWQILAVSLIAGMNIGAMLGLYDLIGYRADILIKMKKKYLDENTIKKGTFSKLVNKQGEK